MKNEVDMFWEKCGKILTQNGEIVNCRDCPCGYWALFVFKSRSYNQETGEPYNDCSWSFDVQPMEVVNSKINYSNYGGRRCIEVNRQPGEDGSVGYVKSCTDCWEDCCEWDDEWIECIRTCSYCMDCSEIYVYRLSPCFDTMREFAEWFYSGCGVEPDGNGNYPALTETWYGYTYISDAASRCVENYWLRKALDKYALNYEVFIDYYAQEWQQWFWSSDNTYTDYTYSYCTSPNDWCDCAEYNDNGCASCPEGCTLESYTEQYIDHENSEGPMVIKLGPKGESAVTSYAPVGGWYGPGDCYYSGECYHPATCCDWRDNAASALASATAPIIPAYSDKNEYIKYSSECFWSQPRSACGTSTSGCSDSGNLCCSFGYFLGVIDYYYWSPCDVRILGNWPRVTIRRNGNTPANARGIRAKVILSNTKNDLGQPSQTTVTEQTVDFLFGQVYEELPTLKNISVLSIRSTWECNSSCSDYEGDFTFEPYTSGAAAENMDVKIIGLEYIF